MKTIGQKMFAAEIVWSQPVLVPRLIKSVAEFHTRILGVPLAEGVPAALPEDWPSETAAVWTHSPTGTMPPARRKAWMDACEEATIGLLLTDSYCIWPLAPTICRIETIRYD